MDNTKLQVKFIKKTKVVFLCSVGNSAETQETTESGKTCN